jgi:hypothetical protein
MGVDTPPAHDGASLPAIQLGVSQNVACNTSAGPAVQSAAFGALTELIMVSGATNDVRIKIGANPQADGGSTLIPHPFVQYFRVFPGWKISVIGNDGDTGSISVTECVSQG